MLMVPQLICWSFIASFLKFVTLIFQIRTGFFPGMFYNKSLLLILYFHISFVFIWRYALKNALYVILVKLSFFL